MFECDSSELSFVVRGCARKQNLCSLASFAKQSTHITNKQTNEMKSASRNDLCLILFSSCALFHCCCAACERFCFFSDVGRGGKNAWLRWRNTPHQILCEIPRHLNVRRMTLVAHNL